MITNLTQYLDRQMENRPKKIALQAGEERLSFEDVFNCAKNIAAKINIGCEGIVNSPIIIFCEKGIIEYISLLGVLYSGNYYVPLDVKMPEERINMILDCLNAKVVITEEKYVGCLKRLGFLGKYLILDKWEDLNYVTHEKLEGRNSIIDCDPAYILFTSGSTGVPKGVVISHRAVIDYIEWQCDTLKFDEDVVLGNQAPFYFDASMPDIYTPLVCGATLDIIPEMLFVFPNKLIEYINKQKINVLIWVPSALITITSKDYFAENLIEGLRMVMFCGEIMPNKHLNVWRRYYPETKFVNLYGPTEAAYACTYYEVNRKFEDDEILPIGRPCGNTGIMVLDESNHLVYSGEGELCIRGTCLSNGYYRNRDKTKEVFVENPLNSVYYDLIYRTGDIVRYNEFGELEYIGRKDFQIKHMGYRIELGEIEMAAYGLRQMNMCCAIYDDERRKILLYCVVNEVISPKEIYAALKEKIPKYMLPAEIIIKEKLPLNANGKVDRASLRGKSK
ncbi:MAG: amino acid adenylation domain-containing protein [Lachnospiraceae bacterium]|nr:amino acid adenylation domain-containing protein [Lachnospiraceae bacterium]